MGEKIKVLFIAAEFWQGGAQRHLYEINKAISKIKFQTSILSLRNLNSSQEWEDYYYTRHLDLGTEIFFLDKINKIRIPSIWERIKHKILGHELPPERESLLDFLNAFDKILFMGEYTYPAIERWLTDEIRTKSFISIVFSVVQVPEKFVNYNKSLRYAFISPFKGKEIDFEFNCFENYKHVNFPFSIDCHEKIPRWKPNNSISKRIGVFTRLTQHKPIDVFLSALRQLIDKGMDASLNVYGNGDPVESGFARNAETLSLQEKVVFKGHQADIIKTALDDKLDMVWFHGYHNFPGGFASFDLSSAGIPQVFWNFTPCSGEENQGVFPMHSGLYDFVDQSYEILNNPQYALDIGLKQYNYITGNRNIKKNIHLLEAVLEEYD